MTTPRPLIPLGTPTRWGPVDAIASFDGERHYLMSRGNVVSHLPEDVVLPDVIARVRRAMTAPMKRALEILAGGEIRRAGPGYWSVGGHRLSRRQMIDRRTIEALVRRGLVEADNRSARLSGLGKEATGWPRLENT